eukprot:UN26523
MNKIKEELDKRDISSKALVGNVHVRNRAIAGFMKNKKFKKLKEIRVILLSTRQSASGTD